MRQVVIRQFATLEQSVDMRQAGLWTIAHRNGYGTIELYNWRRLDSYQLVVEGHNLTPVRRGGRFRLRMNGCDRSLQCVRAELAGTQSFLHQSHSLHDLLPVPE